MRRAKLLVELDDNPEADEDIILILHLKIVKKFCQFRESIPIAFIMHTLRILTNLEELEDEREDLLDVRFEEIIGGQALHHLQYEFADLLYIVLGDEVRAAVLKRMQGNVHLTQAHLENPG